MLAYKRLVLAATVLACVAPLSVGAEERSGVTLTPSVVYYNFDHGVDADDAIGYGLGLGYRFDSPWGIELQYQSVDADLRSSTGELSLDQWRIDGLYHFEMQDKWQPYVALGVGQSDSDALSISTDEDFINAGLGLKYHINSSLAFRPDLRFIRGLDSDNTDVAFSVGLQFKFGGSNASRRPAKKKTRTPVELEVTRLDGDNDGVYDDQDSCPNTPAGRPVDASGCDNDKDRDGVVNAQDQCPNTSTGAKVDTVGCYETLNETVTIELNVTFDNNSDVVKAEFYPQIKKISDFMKTYPLTVVQIEGHTDERGKASYNRSLSQKRADAVAKVLVDHFSTSSERVKSVGVGEDRPLVPNDSEANRAKNRRVVGVVSAKGEKSGG
ncbi:MAG: flagellar motor protein MotB [Alteromonadaceae bacterium]|nr:MAG: flagellar motor protein MotB [Alteromonadaceae bacterium]